MDNILLKIHRGTGQLTGESLCRTCRYGLVVTDARGDAIRCQLTMQYSPRGNVRECSGYYNRGLPSLDDLYKTAWTLRTEKGGRAIGFAPPDAQMTPPRFG